MKTNHTSQTVITLKGHGLSLDGQISVSSDLSTPTSDREVELQVFSGGFGLSGLGTVSIRREDAQALMEALAYHLNAVSRVEIQQ